MNAAYCPVTAKLKIALIAVGPANANSPNSMETMTAAQTQLTGVPVKRLIRYKSRENGSPPSRENAKVWREADVICVIRQ